MTIETLEYINLTFPEYNVHGSAYYLVYLYFYNWLYLYFYCWLWRLLDCLQDSEGSFAVSWSQEDRTEYEYVNMLMNAE